jgi:hypothetical protein
MVEDRGQARGLIMLVFENRTASSFFSQSKNFLTDVAWDLVLKVMNTILAESIPSVQELKLLLLPNTKGILFFDEIFR